MEILFAERSNPNATLFLTDDTVILTLAEILIELLKVCMGDKEEIFLLAFTVSN